MSILIVEDDQINGTIIERMLKSANYGTVLVNSGAEALKTLRLRADIDLIVADIMMPDLSGLELLRVIKDSELLRDVPVIFCSASMDVGKVRLAAALGCCCYLIKPVKRELLLEKVATTLAKLKSPLAAQELVQTRLGIDSATYRELERGLFGLLNSEMDILDHRLKDPAAPTAQMRFKEVAETAASLGAEQLEAKVRSMLNTANKGDFRMEGMRVLREMHRVHDLLQQRIAAENNRPRA
jgi:CheY-like chemotaxis protein